jgi:superoxide dismutase, Fe-Mn family
MKTITRRQAIKATALATAACATTSLLRAAETTPPALAAPPPAPAGPFVLPPLPYAFDALEPHLDARTMEIHHDRHHAAYVANLNKAITEFSDLEKKSIEDLLKNLEAVPEKIRAAVRNNGGGHYNHSLFWQMMKKGGSGEPTETLDYALTSDFGGFATFKQQFTDAATKIFGSGWVWLVLAGKDLKIETTPNQDTPLSAGRPPLLGLDVWEHAYYLKYQNKRADYIAAWWNVVNWDFVAGRYAKLKPQG